jgi:hypothetical protein
MLGSRRRHRLYRRKLHVRDHHALRWPWLIEGIMYEAVQEEEHDQHPSCEESQKFLRPSKFNRKIKTHIPKPLMQQCSKPNTAAE